MARPTRINTTPTVAKPPEPLIAEASLEVPSILADMDSSQPQQDGQIAMVASHLVEQLRNAGHTLAAARWAVHQLVQRGMLVPQPVVDQLPTVGVRRGSRISRLYGKAPSVHIEWHGGQKTTRPIPKFKPALFTNFQVVTTEKLREWWGTAYETEGNDSANQCVTDQGGINARPVESFPANGEAGGATAAGIGADENSGLQISEALFSITWQGRGPLEIGNTQAFRLLQALADPPNEYHPFLDLIERLGGDQFDNISPVKCRLVKLLRDNDFADLADCIKTQTGHYGLFFS